MDENRFYFSKSDAQISYLRSDIVGDFKITVGTCTFSVYNSLGNSLTREMSKFIEEMEILSEDGASWTGSHRVLVVVDGGAGARRDNRLHGQSDSLFVLFFIIDTSSS